VGRQILIISWSLILFAFSGSAKDIMQDYEPDSGEVRDVRLSAQGESKTKALFSFVKAYFSKSKNLKDPENLKNVIDIIKNDPKSKYGLLFFFSEWNFDDKEANKALEELVPVAKQNPDALQLNIIVSTSLVKEKKYEEAIELLENSIDTFDKDNNDNIDVFSCARAISILTSMYLKNGKFSKGDDVFEKFSGYGQFK